jgi:hypothetical protein
MHATQNAYEVYHDSGRNLTLHRCRDCVKRHWYATGNPMDDNGFIPIGQPIRHLAGCQANPRQTITTAHGTFTIAVA